MQKKTRGKTRPERLSLWLRWLRHNYEELNAPPSYSIVDLGYGEKPYSTIELLDAVEDWDMVPAIVGIESSEHRHAQASALQHPKIQFLLGGAEAIVACSPPARLIRAINVLRQYPPDQTAAVRRSWLTFCAPGALITEGTTDRDGNVLGMWLLSRDRPETLILGTRCTHGFAPAQLFAALPNDIRWQHTRPAWVATLFEAWTDNWRQTSSRLEPRERFEQSVHALHEGHTAWVVRDPALWALGLVEFQPDHIKADTGS